MNNEYQQGDTIYILMDAMSAKGLLDDWLHHNYECHFRQGFYKKMRE